MAQKIIPPIENSRKEYLHHAHRMQVGVGMMMEQPDDKSTDPKMLRVGVNAAMSDQAGLVALLIAKGLIDGDEYVACVADQMETKADNYEKEIQKIFGPKVKLGSLYENEEF